MAICDLSQPATTEEIVIEVTTLLTQYYTAALPEAVQKRIMQVWVDALRPYPIWAITSACRWWTSADNKKRQKKPFDGDIVSRCKVEFAHVSIAETKCQWWERYGENPPDILR